MKHLEEAQNGQVAWNSDDGKSHLYGVDCLEFMESLPADSIDCVWTDPPVSAVERWSHLCGWTHGQGQQR